MTTPLAATEADVQAIIADYARMRGWLVAHFRPARVADGWRTAGSYDAKGYPDLTLAKRGRVLHIECKGPRGVVPPEQEAWLAATDGLLATPTNLDAILATIKEADRV